MNYLEMPLVSRWKEETETLVGLMIAVNVFVYTVVILLALNWIH